MDVIVYPGKLSGTVQAPPSKSIAHRALICAALAEGESVIEGISGSRDMDATIDCIRAMGAVVDRQESIVRVQGIGSRFKEGADATAADAPRPVLDCAESGSTFRFMLPIAAAAGLNADFIGCGRLPERPVTELAGEMRKHGVTFTPDDKDALPFTISGKLQPGVYSMPGNVSSQYFSGLLFALPLLDGDSEIQIEGVLESSGYIDLTLDMLRQFDILVRVTENGYKIKGGQSYRAANVKVEGDYSNAAFWLVAGATGSNVVVEGLAKDSLQGDREILDILQEMGATVEWSGDSVHVRGYGLDCLLIDCGEIPDIIPILAVAASTSDEMNSFVNAGRLRIKESDRLTSTAAMMARLGADIQIGKDNFSVCAPDGLWGECVVDGCNDHRIVMSAAIATLRCKEPVRITGAEAVNKSYPNFFDEFRSLGGRVDVVADR